MNMGQWDNSIHFIAFKHGYDKQIDSAFKD